MLWMLLFLALCCFVSALVQRLSGFGLATLLMALLPLFLPFPDALLITGVAGCAGSVALAVQQRAHIQWRQLAVPLAAYVVVGFFVTSALFMFIMMAWMGYKKIWVMLLTIALMLGFIYALFVWQLHVMLPSGFLF